MAKAVPQLSQRLSLRLCARRLSITALQTRTWADPPDHPRLLTTANPVRAGMFLISFGSLSRFDFEMRQRHEVVRLFSSLPVPFLTTQVWQRWQEREGRGFMGLARIFSFLFFSLEGDSRLSF